MAASMTCDDAFDILTRGPFPSGDVRTDELVERHLAACHECRQLAEALRPAVGLFHETLTAAETLCLPGYRGELRPAGTAALKRRRPAALQPTSPTPASTAPSKPQTPAVTHNASQGSREARWMLLAACLIGVGLGVFASVSTEPGRSGASRVDGAASVPSPSATRSEHDRELLLTLLNLPGACRGDAHPSGLELRHTHQCCTLCHNATEAATAPEVKLSMMVGSCLVCHPDNQRAKIDTTPAGRPSTAQI